MIKTLLAGLVAAALSLNPPTSFENPSIVFNNTKKPVPIASINIDGMHHLTCVNMIDRKSYYGSSAKIGDNLLLTAYHVTEGRVCSDTVTSKPYTLVYFDKARDLAILGSEEPITGTKYKVNCKGYIDGGEYFTIGWAHGQEMQVNHLIASNKETDEDFLIENESFPGFRLLKGRLVRGMSGGPIVDIGGNITGINNYTDSDILAWGIELKKTGLCK